MKFYLYLFCFFLSLSLSAQTKEFPKPAWDDQVMLYDSASNNLSDLENRKFDFKMGTTGSMYLKIEGGTSPIRFKSGDNLNFVIKPKFKEQNPANHLGFTVLKAEKKIRTYKWFQNNIVNGKVSSFETSGLKFRKISDEIILISFDKPLPSGEYCFYTLRAGFPYDYYAFGVD